MRDISCEAQHLCCDKLSEKSRSGAEVCSQMESEKRPKVDGTRSLSAADNSHWWRGMAELTDTKAGTTALQAPLACLLFSYEFLPLVCCGLGSQIPNLVRIVCKVTIKSLLYEDPGKMTEEEASGICFPT